MYIHDIKCTCNVIFKSVSEKGGSSPIEWHFNRERKPKYGKG